MNPNFSCPEKSLPFAFFFFFLNVTLLLFLSKALKFYLKNLQQQFGFTAFKGISYCSFRASSLLWTVEGQHTKLSFTEELKTLLFKEFNSLHHGKGVSAPAAGLQRNCTSTYLKIDDIFIDLTKTSRNKP